MTTIGLTVTEKPTWAASLVRALMAPVLVFAITFLGYYASGFLVDGEANPWCGGDRVHPACWYQHYTYLAKAITQGSLDVGDAGIPDFYQDTLTVEGNKYVPFAPAPSLLLLPFVAIWGTDFSQVYFSLTLGAINSALVWVLLGMLNVSRRTQVLVTLFFAFGTVHFYSATTGTAWFYSHVAGIFFMLLAVMALLRRAPPVVPAALVGFSFLSREATLFAAPFFLYYYWRKSDRKLFDMGQFCGALVPFGIFALWYNWVRFGSVFETGYEELYHIYSGIQYSVYKEQFADGSPFGYFDVRNIPIHLYNIFIMPPEYVDSLDVFRPSRYGMSLLLTSPLFVFAGFVRRKDVLRLASWLAIGAVSVPILLNAFQGWVQFGYRFSLDFTPFLLILTAYGLEDNQSPTARRLAVFLLALSIAANIWGRYWGTKLGW